MTVAVRFRLGCSPPRTAAPGRTPAPPPQRGAISTLTPRKPSLSTEPSPPRRPFYPASAPKPPAAPRPTSQTAAARSRCRHPWRCVLRRRRRPRGRPRRARWAPLTRRQHKPRSHSCCSCSWLPSAMPGLTAAGACCAAFCRCPTLHACLLHSPSGGVLCCHCCCSHSLV